MALRWYSVVVDCADVKAQAAWWAEALDWRLIIETDDECVIIPSWVDEQAMRETPWERVGPGIVFVPVPEGKAVKNRLHLDFAPHTIQDRDAEIAGCWGWAPAASTSASRTARAGPSWPTPRATSSASSAPGTADHAVVISIGIDGAKPSQALASPSTVSFSANSSGSGRKCTVVPVVEAAGSDTNGPRGTPYS